MFSVDKMSYGEAIKHLRNDKNSRQIIIDSYLDENVLEAAKRFAASVEFSETLKIIGPLKELVVLDLGAGNGIASYAFALNGAKEVIAFEPDDCPVTGVAVINDLVKGMSVKTVKGYAEAIPLADDSVDIVYGRQVLHHLPDLNKSFSEIARILKRGGHFIFVREPVVDSAAELKTFLEKHIMHNLACNESAYSQDAYIAPAVKAGLRVDSIIQHWDTVINAYPSVTSNKELEKYPAYLLKKKLGFFGVILSFVPFVLYCVKKRIKRKVPGRLIAFYGTKN